MRSEISTPVPSATLSEELSRQIIRSSVAKIAATGNRVTVPMIITGTLSAPVYALDTKALNSKVKEQINKQVKEKVRKLFKELEK